MTHASTAARPRPRRTGAEYALQALSTERDVGHGDAHRRVRRTAGARCSAAPLVDAFVAWPTDLLRPPVRYGDASRSGSRETGAEPALAGAAELGRAGVERRRARHLVQAARDRRRTAIASACWCGSPRAPTIRRTACRRRGAAPARRRAVDRRPEVLSGGLQPRRAGHRRQARLERDRLHLRSHHLARRPDQIGRPAKD